MALDPDFSRRSELEARNASLRKQIDNMVSQLGRRTSALRQKQAEATQQTSEVTSEDGLVTARVNATGALQELTLAPKAFERTSPERLARVVTSVIREASGTRRRAMREQFEPMVQDVPDLSELVPGAPSLKGLLRSGPLVEPPDPEVERAQRAGALAPESKTSSPHQETPAPSRPKRQSRPRLDDDDDDGMADSWLV